MEGFEDLPMKTPTTQNAGTATVDVESTHFQGSTGTYRFSANIWLALVRKAWDSGMNVEDVVRTHGDWSFIRDATPEQQGVLAARAVFFLGIMEA